ncbi:MAG: TetR/AcrR family transcriptional regulator [Clostridiales bacterium]|jgi:AcrR family transcriptional regulator|nr:TetR/AcrR family transcriptional regulator [Clostridiales bacterium]
MPRALTEHEKCKQCQKLLEKGKSVVMSHGMKKISVDDIAKAAGMAKGTFYQHFESKEKFLFALVKDIHVQIFAQAMQIIKNIFSGENEPREDARNFLKELFNMPEMIFFIKNGREIDELLFDECETQSFKQMEVKMFENILNLISVDTQKVKPGVVHNYIHAVFMVQSSDLMFADDVHETTDLIMESLVSYVFGGAQ